MGCSKSTLQIPGCRFGLYPRMRNWKSPVRRTSYTGNQVIELPLGNLGPQPKLPFPGIPENHHLELAEIAGEHIHLFTELTVLFPVGVVRNPLSPFFDIAQQALVLEDLV